MGYLADFLQLFLSGSLLKVVTPTYIFVSGVKVSMWSSRGMSNGVKGSTFTVNGDFRLTLPPPKVRPEKVCFPDLRALKMSPYFFTYRERINYLTTMRITAPMISRATTKTTIPATTPPTMTLPLAFGFVGNT